MLVFFSIAFGIPWIVWTLMHFYEVSDSIRAALFYFGNFCSIGGLVAAFIASKKSGIFTMFRRLVDFNFPKKWWIFALVIPFFYMTIAFVLGSRSQIGGLGHIEPAQLLIIFSAPAFAMFLTGPIGQEFGWRGFLLPKLLEKFTPFSASILLGLIWGFWYFPIYFGTIFHSFYTGFVFIVHIVFMSIIMTVIFLNTRGNLLIAMIYHWLANVLQVAFAAVFVSTNTTFDPFQNVGELVVIGILFVFHRKQMLERYDGELLFFKEQPVPVAPILENP
jgi:hypothetical protein